MDGPSSPGRTPHFEILAIRAHRREILAALAVTAVAALYMYRFIYRGWMPQDDGLHGQMTERTLAGELSHVDFDDPYTGGLNLLHALFCLPFGLSLQTIRFAQYAFFLLAVPVLFLLARRTTTTPVAAVLALTGVAWGLVNFPIPAGNWYNLVICILSAGCIALYLDGGGRRYLFAVGLLVGLSLTIKVTGLYYLAATLLFVLHHESVTFEPDPARTGSGLPAFFALRVGALMAPALAVAVLIQRTFSATEVVHYLVPAALLSAALVPSDWKHRASPVGVRLRRLCGLLAPILAGLALPIAAFTARYVFSGHVRELLHGLFVAPTARFEWAYWGLAPLSSLVSWLPALACLAVPWLPLPGKARIAVLLLLFLGGIPLTLPPLDRDRYVAVWIALRGLVPITGIACAGLMLADRSRERSAESQLTTYLVLLLAYMSLVQYPWQIPVYVLFVVPALILALFRLLQRLHPDYWRCYAPALGFAFVWALLWVNPGDFRSHGGMFVPTVETEPMELERGRLYVARKHRELYEALVATVEERSGDSPCIFAFPDCPDVYFLAKKRNPTPITLDFLRPRWGAPALLAMLEEHRIKVVVVRRNVEFSQGYATPELLAALQGAFPRVEDFGHFVVLSRP